MHERLRELVKASGLTQAVIATDLGVSEPKLSRLLSGKRRASVEEVESILSVLRTRTGRKRGLNLNDLFAATGKGRAA